MLTLINNEFNRSKILSLVSRKNMTMKHIRLVEVTENIDAELVKAKDGTLYYYDRIYIFADATEKVHEIIFLDNGEIGLTSIRPAMMGTKDKEMIRKLDEFLSVLHSFFKYLIERKELSVTSIDHTLYDIRETIIKQNSLKNNKENKND